MGVTERSGAKGLPLQAGVKARRKQDRRSRVSLRWEEGLGASRLVKQEGGQAQSLPFGG